MQVGDALVAVDHGHGRTVGVDGFHVGIDGSLFGFRQGGDLGEDITQAEVGVNAQLGEGVGVFGEHGFEENADGVAEEDGVGDLHHGGFEVQGPEHALFFGFGDGFGQEATQFGGAHHGGVDDFGFLQGNGAAQIGNSTGAVAELDAYGLGLLADHGLFAAEEIAFGHVGNAGLGIAAPGTHGVRMLAGKVFNRRRGAAVGVAFAQNGVYGRAKDLGVARFDIGFLVIGRVDGEVGNGIALALQFADGRLELGDGGANVGQLNDVGIWGFGELAQFA